MLKAIYVQDVNFDNIPVYSLDLETNKFKNGEVSYDFDTVMNSVKWKLFISNDGNVYPVKSNMQLLNING